MTIPIIATKLHVPQLPKSLVPRGHLIARLEVGAQGRLILVSAPAGFGKTSLIAEWAHQCMGECFVSWVHLDEGDNEFVRFLSYLIAALQTHHQDIGEATLSGLQAMPPAPIEAALTSLINDVNSIRGRTILVLDDYHLIDNSSIHEAVSFIIEHLPEQVCLVIGTRTDPPLPIHRLRARGQMTELRAKDLRFSIQETRDLLEMMLEMEFSAGDIAVLDRRVEGWAAGLQMLALSIQGREDVQQFIESFSGSHRYIMDYLTEEIYNQQPPHIRDFLLGTSILDRLSGPLCEAIMSAGEGEMGWQGENYAAQQVLEDLEQANLFVHPLDDEKRWYRYHNLFAELLRQRLRQTWPDEIEGLRQRAAHWFAGEGYIDEAFSYALSTDDLSFAVDLIERHALGLLKSGALTTLLSGIRRLPAEIVMRHPWLNVYYSWGLLLTGELEGLDGYLRAAEELQESLTDSRDLSGHIAAIRSYALLLMGKVDEAYAQAKEALVLLPEDELTVRSVVYFVLGGVNVMRQDIPEAMKAMLEAGEIGEQAGNIHLAVSAKSSAGYMLLSLGRLAEAEQVYERALKLATGKSGKPLPIAANVFSGLAQLYLSQHDLGSARRSAQMGIELAGQWGNMDSLAGSYLSLAQVCQLEGDHSEAQNALEEAKRIASTHTLSPGFDERLAGVEAMKGDVQQGMLVEPLTEREMEVLRLLAEGRSNPEIADELIIALGTVKAHTASIYRKLDVRNRTEAVVKANELGLL